MQTAFNIAGNIETFNATRFRAGLLALHPTAVRIDLAVDAASVRVTVHLHLPDDEAATAAASALAARPIGELARVLDVEIESMSPPEVRTRLVPAPAPPPPPTPEFRAALTEMIDRYWYQLAGLVVGLIAFCCWRHRRRQRMSIKAYRQRLARMYARAGPGPAGVVASSTPQHDDDAALVDIEAGDAQFVADADALDSADAPDQKRPSLIVRGLSVSPEHTPRAAAAAPRPPKASRAPRGVREPAPAAERSGSERRALSSVCVRHATDAQRQMAAGAARVAARASAGGRALSGALRRQVAREMGRTGGKGADDGGEAAADKAPSIVPALSSNSDGSDLALPSFLQGTHSQRPDTASRSPTPKTRGSVLDPPPKTLPFDPFPHKDDALPRAMIQVSGACVAMTAGFCCLSSVIAALNWSS